MASYPILYNYASDSLDSMGIGVMKGVEICTIQRDANAFPVLSMTYKASDELAKDIQLGEIIVTSIGPQEWEQRQRFRIVDIQASPTSDTMTITANHVAGDLATNLLTKDISIANANPTTVFNEIKKSLADETPQLSFYSDILRVANVGWQVSDGNYVSSIMLGADQAGDSVTNTMQAIYKGEWKFDNYNLSLLNQAGRDTGIIIKYGRRLKTLEQERNIQNTYNAILPYATYTPNTVLVDGNNEPMDGQGVVQYIATGGATIYNSPNKDHVAVGKVQNGTYYKVTAKATENTINGNTWYEIAPNQWIDEHFFTFDKSGAYVVNKIVGMGTVRISESGSQGMYIPWTGVGTVQYAGLGRVLLWDSPFSGRQPTKNPDQFVANGSSYKIFYKAIDEDGKTWYCLGSTDGHNSQWIDSQYFSISKTGDFATHAVNGILQISKTPVTAMTVPGITGTTISWTPTVGSRWKVSQEASDDSGNAWYQVATNIWVKGDNVEFKTPSTVDATSAEDADTERAKSNGVIPVYSLPNGTNVTTETLKVGTQVKITAQAESNGKTYYEIGTNEWVDASFLDFSNLTDVTPSGDSNSDVQVETQTLTLDPPVIRSEITNGEERLRIQRVDLTNYNVGNDKDKLKEVALQYMKEYRIGYPEVSLTLTYQQIADEIDLYDIVNVYFEQLDIAEKAEVNSVTWDALAKEFTTITIGKLPITYEHILGNIEKKSERQVATLEKKSNHLFGQMNQAMKLQGDDQKASIIKIAQDLQMTSETYTRDYDKLQSAIDSINSTVTDVQGWINSSGSGVITAYPNWANPTELRAKSANGGYLQFNGNGIMYVGEDGILRSSIDSQGRTVAESITAGTIKGLTLEGVEIKSSSEIHSNGRYATVMSGAKGFSCDSDDGHIGINSTTIYLNSTMNAGITKSYIRLINDKTGRDVGLTGFEFSQLKELLRKNGMETSD